MVNNKIYFKFSPLEDINEFSKRMNDEFNTGEIGYYHLPELGYEAINVLKKFDDKFSKFNTIVLMGIGGSSLGVQTVYEMLNLKSSKKIIFLDNLDPFEFYKKTKDIVFNETLFLISSKSGTTIEPISIFKCVVEKFNVKDFSCNFAAITDLGSPLENFAKKHDISVFYIPKNVGGRFSVLSMIGLVPLYFCGFDVISLLDGAKACKKNFLEDQNDTILQKAYHYATHKNATINVLFSYCDRFDKFNDWYVQLWAESLGKKKGYQRIGLTPVGLVGSRDQHSFLQLIMDGVKDKTVTFIKVLNHDQNINIANIKFDFLQDCDFVNSYSLQDVLNTQCEASLKAIIAEGISVDLIEVDKIDEWHIGYLLYYFELLTSATGIMLGINTYDQPGVEVGKRILKKMLLPLS